ncbi:nucleotide-sugar transporter domain-containing protein [Ditylenchus destructor]|uniref:Nucleotide-sugar transporter domain-containing protein n=1 Tax=Ditylenchus destructor TaxID=166010 RepID=A0AAD4NBE6_9BILA|nr:nucleotide-sugar transporter domain-containing protein [Ditylenchus destructor]
MSPSHSPQGSISKAPILIRSSPSIQSNKLKWVSLVVLIAQTTALVLILRYSRMPSKKIDTPEGKDAPENVKYLSSTAVLMAEIIKFFTCILVLLIHNKLNIDRFYKEIDLDIMKKGRDTMKVGVPALLYVVQNNLLFLALSKLDAATYQLPKDKPQTEKEVDEAGKLVGLFAVIAACFSSGFAGVYFEKILKTSVVSLWIRNLQLAFFSIFGAFFMTWLYDWEAVQKNGFFQGYDWVIWVVVLLQAYGGLVIALVVKYADNILKGFAVSLSIILSSLISWYMGDFESSLAFFIGATVVIISTFMYGYEPKTLQQAHSA